MTVDMVNETNHRRQSRTHISVLHDSGDERGGSFHSVLREIAGFLGSIQDMHIATIRPSFFRGNHYHRRQHEATVVIYSGEWSFFWDSGPKTETNQRNFSGKGAVLLKIEPNSSHTILNNGDSDLCILAFSNRPSDTANPDSYRRSLM
jgi:dTDP-4-dehydrorhamnose 3,5-epimerase-like enzyme